MVCSPVAKIKEILDLMQNMTLDLLVSSRDHTFYGPYKGPRSGPYLDLGLKVLILQKGPHRFMKDHIGTMVMFYIRSKIFSCLFLYQMAI